MIHHKAQSPQRFLLFLLSAETAESKNNQALRAEKIGWAGVGYKKGISRYFSGWQQSKKFYLGRD